MIVNSELSLHRWSRDLKWQRCDSTEESWKQLSTRFKQQRIWRKKNPGNWHRELKFLEHITRKEENLTFMMKKEGLENVTPTTRTESKGSRMEIASNLLNEFADGRTKTQRSWMGSKILKAIKHWKLWRTTISYLLKGYGIRRFFQFMSYGNIFKTCESF